MHKFYLVIIVVRIFRLQNNEKYSVTGVKLIFWGFVYLIFDNFIFI